MMFCILKHLRSFPEVHLIPRSTKKEAITISNIFKLQFNKTNESVNQRWNFFDNLQQSPIFLSCNSSTTKACIEPKYCESGNYMFVQLHKFHFL